VPRKTRALFPLVRQFSVWRETIQDRRVLQHQSCSKDLPSRAVCSTLPVSSALGRRRGLPEPPALRGLPAALFFPRTNKLITATGGLREARSASAGPSLVARLSDTRSQRYRRIWLTSCVAPCSRSAPADERSGSSSGWRGPTASSRRVSFSPFSGG